MSRNTTLTTMSPNTTRYFNELLTIFDAALLGEGDLVAGANRLAAMACSLANIARPGSCLVAADESTLKVGTSLLVSGPHSAGLISSEVLGGLGDRQNNLLTHLRRHRRETEEDSKKKGPKMDPDRPLLPADEASAFLWSNSDLEDIGDFEASTHWGTLVREPARPDADDIVERPLVFITGDTASFLTKQLERCHLGRPYVHVGVNRAADFARHEHTCPLIMDGRSSAGPSAEIVRGTVVLTDPSGILGEAVRSDLPWLSQMPWLVDGNAGPEPDGTKNDKPVVALGRMEVRYQMAMDKAWGERINNLATSPTMEACDFAQPQADWIAFLKTMEPECPGITGTARSLFATLGFGLQKMVSALNEPNGFKWSINHIEALAQFLVHRMVNARTAMLRSTEDAKRRKLEADILHKLRAGPHDCRGLIRRFSRLPTAQCRELLFGLEASGRVIRSGDDMWQLAEPTSPAASDDGRLILEA